MATNYDRKRVFEDKFYRHWVCGAINHCGYRKDKILNRRKVRRIVNNEMRNKVNE